MKFKHIIFDLDGTLSNSYYGITNGVSYALQKMGITPKNRSELRKFIGPPLVQGFMEYYGMSRQEGDRAVKLYREYYTDKGIYENELYEGIEDVLKYIEKNGGKMYIATSKPQKYTEIILKYLKIEKYFTYVRGVGFDTAEVTKDVLINDICEKFNLKKQETIMVGDTKFDISGAKNAGITALGVMYGFGTENQLRENGADIIVNTPIEMTEVL